MILGLNASGQVSFSHSPVMQIVKLAGMPALLSSAQGTVQYVGTEARENGFAHSYLQQPTIKPIHVMISHRRSNSSEASAAVTRNRHPMK